TGRPTRRPSACEMEPAGERRAYRRGEQPGSPRVPTAGSHTQRFRLTSSSRAWGPTAGGCSRAPGGALRTIFLDGQVADHRVVAVRVVYEAHVRHERLDHVDLLHRRHDEQLQSELSKQFEAEPRRFIRASAERLIDEDKVK